MAFSLREYRPEDLGEMAALFYDTVHTVNAGNYTREQLDAWATGQVDEEAWDSSFRAHFTLVAVEEGRIVGFGDMDESGYLDRLYVHRDRQGEGIASALCDALESRIPGRIETHASITARPFFEGRGYRVIREQQVERRGVLLTNFVMEKRREGMTEVRFYDSVEDKLLKYAVILARTEGKWVFCRHRDRTTWEAPGGHREPGEDILTTARRELWEETGATAFTLRPVCAYSATDYGMLFTADITAFEPLRFEIEELLITDSLPESWTYPDIMPKLLAEAERRGVFENEGK